jgi:hypothetical protein
MGLRLRVCALWLSIAPVLAGCAGRSDPPVTIEQACLDLGQVTCAAFQRCSPENFGTDYPDAASCISVRTLDCVERRWAPGNTTTGDQVAACARATSQQTCDQIVASEFGVAEQVDPACTWHGTLLDGEACISSGQCATGTCAFYDRDACGTCLTRADSSCTVASECLVTSLCVNGQCVVAREEGEACGALVPCRSELTCRAGLCAERGRDGDECGTSDTGACAPDLRCNQRSGLCEHATLSGEVEDCAVTDSGSSVRCPAGTFCKPDASGDRSSCARAGAEGSPCSYRVECGVGLACYESSCQKLRAEACAPPGTSPDSTYPARQPSVPRCLTPPSPMLLTKPKVVLVTFKDDSRASTLEAFVNALGSSGYWHSTTSEYGIAELEALPAIRLRESPPSKLADADIRTWLLDKLSNDERFPQSDARTLYILAYPSGVAITGPGSSSEGNQSCRDFGGYHDSFNDPNGTHTPYAVIPDCAYNDAEAALSHETIEAATDPFSNLGLLSFAPSGYGVIDAPHFVWSLPAGGGAELADMCEWQPMANYQDPEVGGMVQRSWSNAAMAAFHQPCVPAQSSNAYFNSVPHLDDVVTVRSARGTTKTRGIAIPIGQSHTVPVDMLSDGPTGGPWRVSAYDLKEWSQQFDYRTGAEPTLRFSFDRQSGVNGDVLQMTISVLKQDSDYHAEPFVLVSRRGRDTNLWVGLVGQP